MPRRRPIQDDDDNDDNDDDNNNDESNDETSSSSPPARVDRNAGGRRPPHDLQENDKEEEDETETETETLRLLTDSGLTEDDRRQIRREQRELLKELTEDRGDPHGGNTGTAAGGAGGVAGGAGAVGVGGCLVEQARKKNNRLYRNVRYTREAVLDGENLMSIAQKASQKVDRLIQVPRYDADRLVHKLVGQVRAGTSLTPGGGGGADDGFDWELLGEAAGACFNAVPSDVCFLNGPLQKDAPPVPRRVAPQHPRRQSPLEEAVEERPEDVQGHTEKDDNKLSAIEKSMQDMAKELKNKVDHQYRDNKRKLEQAYGSKDAIPMDIQKKFKKYGVEIDAIQFLFNPKSFTQTVENIFHYSFLVKKGTGAIALRDEKGLNVEGIQTKPGLKLKYVSEDKMAPIARQSIMSLTMHDWRALCEAYQVEDGGLPHRKIHKEAHANSLSQASGIASSQ